MPAWFIDIESATDTEAKSNGTPPAARTASHASRAKWPSSALHGVTRPSVEATPTKGFFRSSSERPSARRNARCGARSRPSTVMREGSFFVFTDDLFNAGAGWKAQVAASLREHGFGRAVHHCLHRGIGREAHLPRGTRFHGVPHLLRAHADAVQRQRAARAEALGGNSLRVEEGRDDLVHRNASEARPGRDRARIVAPGERLADDRARPAGDRGVRAAGGQVNGGG